MRKINELCCVDYVRVFVNLGFFKFITSIVIQLICYFYKLACVLLCFSHNISSIVGVLCNYGGTIIDIDNDITYHGESIEFCSLRLDSSFIELKVLVC